MADKDIVEILSWINTPLDLYSITDETSLLYYIDEIERTFRSSRPYKGWIVWKRNKHEQTVCKILNIDTDDFKEVHIQQHHWPVSLFDIVMIIGMKMISELKEDEYLTVFDIVSEVMKIHLDEHNYIGTVPLTTTFHELYHAGEQKLKLEYINGNYRGFLDKYRKYIPSAVQERITYNLNSLNK